MRNLLSLIGSHVASGQTANSQKNGHLKNCGSRFTDLPTISQSL